MTVNQAGAISRARQAQVAPAANKPLTLQDQINKMMPAIKMALPKTITPERFTRICLSAVSGSPQLQQCDPTTFLAAMMQSAQLGLEPNTPLGQAYLIPYYNNRKGRYEAQFQLGYKGLLNLAHRSGDVKFIGAETVYENDEFDYELGLSMTLKHKPATSERGKAVYYYAVYKLTNGGEGFAVMSKADVVKHRETYSKAQNSPWNTNFDEMAKKTVLKKLLKYMPLSTEAAARIATDQTVKAEITDRMEDVPSVWEVDFEEHTEEDEELRQLDARTDPVTGEVKDEPAAD